MPAPSDTNAYLAEHIQLLRHSFKQVVGQDFPIPPSLDSTPNSAISEPMVSDAANAVDAVNASFAKAIYHAPFVVVSHNTDADPIFNYGNQIALDLFEMTWDEFTVLPSRQSAELPNREERSRLLHAVTTQGYIRDYHGIRMSKTGKRFRIEDVIVWNLLDSQGNYHGQAAFYSKWTYL